MAKYFITGNAGTGKSSTIRVLQERGFTAYDIDERPDIHAYIDTKDGSIIETLPEITAHGAAAFTRYRSILKEVGLKQLLETDETVFVGGSVTMQQQFYPLFSMIFGLVLAKGPLDIRLANRTNNPTGNNPTDRAYLLSINDGIEANLRQANAILIDASQPLNNVVDNILSHLGNLERVV